MDFEILQWDSSTFEIPTAMITKKLHSEEQFRSLVVGLKNAGIRLAYYFSPVKLGDFAEDLGGSLVDRKTTFYQSTKDFLKQEIPEAGAVEPYDQDTATEDMVSLAVQSGVYSRFAVDPFFPRKKFEHLYTVWLNRSIKKEIADEVFVSKQDGKITGFITVGSNNDIGEIGLIAVNAAHRRKNNGKFLVQNALHWCGRMGLAGCRVVTQEDNIPACKLYIKCGFEIQKKVFVYHFWPDALKKLENLSH